MKNRILYYQRIIESTDWDNELIKKEPFINKGCWAVASIAVLFFGAILFKIVVR
jgi:hypothetical protein